MDNQFQPGSTPQFDLPPAEHSGTEAETAKRYPPHVDGITHDDERVTAFNERSLRTPTANGNGAKPNQPVSLFWQQPISSEEEVNWFVPPLPRRPEQSAQIESMLDDLARMTPDTPLRSWLTRWNYHTRSAASAAEQVDVELEAERRFVDLLARSEKDGKRLDVLIAALEAREKDIEEDVAAAQKEFAEAAAKAGLACEPHAVHRSVNAGPVDAHGHHTASKAQAAGKPRSGGAHKPAPPDPIADLHYAPSGINPQCVEDALQNEVPDLDGVAGAYGVSPVPHSSLWGTILTFFMQFMAPVVCGFMLALCLGTLVGILDLDDFSRRDSVPKFVLAATLGFVIVYLMGELFSNAIHALTRSLEMRGDELPSESRTINPLSEDLSPYARERAAAESRPVPRAPKLRAGLKVAIGLLSCALLLGFAEVLAEGNGIRELHHQQIARRMRFRSPTSLQPPDEELPMALYLIIGTLISGPYLMYKASKAWSESDIQLREAWLLHHQQNWLDDRRARPETGLAFQAACRVEQLENAMYDIKIQLKTLRERRANLYNPEQDQATQTRRKEARAAAVGEALRLQTMIEDVVNQREPVPSQPPPLAPRADRDAPVGRPLLRRP